MEYNRNAYPAISEEWKYPGVKYGWSFRMKDKKRAILPDIFRLIDTKLNF